MPSYSEEDTPVGTYTPATLQSVSCSSPPLSPRLITGRGVTDRTKSLSREPSPCPSTDSRQCADGELEEEDSYIVRVSVCNSDTCNYKSVLVSDVS